MTLNSRWTWTVIALLTGFLLLAATGFGVLTSGMTSQQLAEDLSRQIDAAPAEEAPALLAQLATTGDAAIPLLVRHLNSPKPATSLAARTELSQMLNRWRMLKASSASPKAALLAKELARQCQDFSPAGQRISADFASRLLAWPVDRSAIDGAQLIAHCGEVLRAGDGILERRRPAAATTATLPQNDTGTTRRLRYSDAVLRDPPEEIPVDIVGIPALPPSVAPVAPQPVRTAPPGNPVGSVVPGAPPRALTPGETPEVTPGGTSPPSQPGELPGAYPSGAPRRLEPREDASSSTDIKPVQAASPLRLVSAHLPQRNRDAADFEGLPLFEVVSALQSPSASIVSGALRELRKRGFGPTQIRLAEWFVDGDPAKRMELLRALPEAEIIDAGQWTLWLTYDTDPLIRKAAVTSLQGNRSAGAARRLAQMELEEANLEVLQQVKRIRAASRQHTNLR